MRAGVGIVVVIIVAACAMAGESDAFRSATAGFEITKPADWHYLTAEQNQENLSRVELTDDEYKEALLKYATVPLVAMVKYAEPFDDLNPSVKVNIKPLGELKGMAATEILSLFIPQLEKLFQDFEVAEGPQPVEVSGFPAGYLRVHYNLRVGDGAFDRKRGAKNLVPGPQLTASAVQRGRVRRRRCLRGGSDDGSNRPNRDRLEPLGLDVLDLDLPAVVADLARIGSALERRCGTLRLSVANRAGRCLRPDHGGLDRLRHHQPRAAQEQPASVPARARAARCARGPHRSSGAGDDR